jgi:riboflavin synthase
MFTGIIEELGEVELLELRQTGARLRVRCATVLADAHFGASIAVNGVCLTAVDITPRSFSADLAPETLRRTSLGALRPGSAVNLERPLSPASRLGGHIVQGHVDGVGELISLDALGDGNWWLQVRVPPELDRYLVFKGSVALDGISLTVADIDAGRLAVTIIPHTYQNTNLKQRRPGDRVNIECDVLAKYVEKLVANMRAVPSGLTIEKLREEGY